MKAAYWEEAYRLRSYEVDFQNRLRLSVLFHFMQETASNQIERQGVGIDVLRADNLAWVLSRLLIVMDRYPGWGRGNPGQDLAPGHRAPVRPAGI